MNAILLNTVSFPGLGLEFDLNPVMFEIGPVRVTWYGFLIAMGMLLAMLFAYWKAPKFGIIRDKLMDAALGGNYGVSLQPGEEKTLYKRFVQTSGEEAIYLVLTWCEGGGRESRYFLLEERAIYPELKDGSRGDDVVALQTRLIELGYLDDDADGIFGPNTEGAVRAARVAAGLAESGVADDEMQFLLFREDFPAAPQE